MNVMAMPVKWEGKKLLDKYIKLVINSVGVHC